MHDPVRPKGSKALSSKAPLWYYRRDGVSKRGTCVCMMLALRGAVGVGVGACFLFSNSSRGGLRRHAGAPDDRNSHIKSDDRWLAAEPTFQLQGVSHARRHRVIPGEKMELPPPPLPPPRPDIIEMRWFIVLDYGHPTAPLPHSERTLERTLERTQNPPTTARRTLARQNHHL